MYPPKTNVYGWMKRGRKAREAALVDALRRQGACGVYFTTRIVNESAQRAADAAREAGMDFILSTHHIPASNDKFVKDCLRVTQKLAFGMDPLGEWRGDWRFAARYQDDAKRMGYTWVCPILHHQITKDIRKGGEVGKQLAERGTQCFTSCGYHIIGYLYADPKVPYHRVRGEIYHGKNMAVRHQISVERLQEWLAPLDVWTGAGWQAGLDAGVRVYAQQLGFSGVACGMPFDLAGSMDVKVKDAPTEYPKTWGIYE